VRGLDSLDGLLETLGEGNAILGVDVGKSQRAVLDELGVLDLFDGELLVLDSGCAEGDGSKGQRGGEESVEGRHCDDGIGGIEMIWREKVTDADSSGPR
jgi:hypothetical protein